MNVHINIAPNLSKWLISLDFSSLKCLVLQLASCALHGRPSVPLVGFARCAVRVGDANFCACLLHAAAAADRCEPAAISMRLIMAVAIVAN